MALDDTLIKNSVRYSGMPPGDKAERCKPGPNRDLAGTDVFPFIGKLPIHTIGPRDVLDKAVRKLEAIEARGSIDTAHRAKRYVFSSLRSGERPMSDNTINTALRGLPPSKLTPWRAFLGPSSVCGDRQSLGLYSGQLQTA